MSEIACTPGAKAAFSIQAHNRLGAAELKTEANAEQIVQEKLDTNPSIHTIVEEGDLVILGMGNPHRLTPRELLHAWRVRHDDPDMVVVYKRPGGGLIDSSDPKSLPLAV